MDLHDQEELNQHMDLRDDMVDTLHSKVHHNKVAAVIRLGSLP